MAKPIRVLLYYKYLPIENAEQFAADHLAFCKSIGLKGRILVADEGINGTVSGDYETTQKYMDYVHSLPGMEDLWFKIDEEEEQAFKKMFVRYKKEIVHLGLEDDNFDSDINPLETTGAYLSPKEFKDALLDEDTVVLDTRNDYEYDLGHIKRSSWTSAWLCTVLVESAVRNSQVGWSVKATKMLANCTVVSQLTEKIQRFKGSFGMVRCMSLTSVLLLISTM